MGKKNIIGQYGISSGQYIREKINNEFFETLQRNKNSNNLNSRHFIRNNTNNLRSVLGANNWLNFNNIQISINSESNYYLGKAYFASEVDKVPQLEGYKAGDIISSSFLEIIYQENNRNQPDNLKFPSFEIFILTAIITGFLFKNIPESYYYLTRTFLLSNNFDYMDVSEINPRSLNLFVLSELKNEDIIYSDLDLRNFILDIKKIINTFKPLTQQKIRDLENEGMIVNINTPGAVISIDQ